MERVEYHPHFWSEKIYTPMVLGAEPNYTQYYKWLYSGVFSFFHSELISTLRNELPARDIHKYMLQLNGEITTIARCKYENKSLQVMLKVNCDIISNKEDEAIEITFEMMYQLVQKLKIGMYEESSHKNELDELYTRQQNLLRSVNGPVGSEFDYIRDRIETLSHRINFEFERIIMGADGGAAMLDDFCGISTSQSLRDFPSVTIKKKVEVKKTEEEEFIDIDRYQLRHLAARFFAS